MNKRINLMQIHPKAYEAITVLQNYIQEAGIDPVYKLLIGIRVSEINGCTLCLEQYLKEADRIGMIRSRAMAVSSWRQSPLFTADEKAILALAEEMTYIYNGVSEETYKTAELMLGEIKLAEIMLAVVTVNGWNRLAVSTRQLVYKTKLQ